MAENDFRKDLSNLVTDSSFYTNMTGAKMDALDEMQDKYEGFIDDILSDKFKLSSDDIDDIGDTEDKLQYIKNNIWKLKPADFGQMKEKSYFLGQEKFKLEDEIRNDLEEIFKKQDETIKQNSEILESVKDKLLADKEAVTLLEAEIKRLEEEILNIDSAIATINADISSKEAEISSIEAEISENKTKISDKEADSLEADKEINSQKILKEQKQIEINNLTAEKKEVERQLKEATRELENAKKKDPKGNHATLENQVRDLETKNIDIGKDISNVRTNISTIDSLIRDQITRKTNNDKAIKKFSDENKNKEFTLNNARKDLSFKLSERTKKSDMKIERQGKIASNQSLIDSYRIAERQAEYDEKFRENSEFVAEIYADREDIKRTFKDYKIEVPDPKRADKAEDSQTPANATQEGAEKGATGGAAASGVAAPAEEMPELSDKQLAKNFVNDVTKFGTSAEELRLKLSGYGYGTFVNALPHLNTLDRHKVLKVLEERRNDVKTTPRDEIEIDNILGDGAYDLIMENGYPRDINTLSVDELWKLRQIIDEYNCNILNYSDEQLKVVEEKFLDTLSNSTLIANYKESKIQRAFNMHRGGVYPLRRELIGSMKFYNQNKAKRFQTVVNNGNAFFENLHREKNPTVVADPSITNVPEISNDRSALQNEYRNRNNTAR